ncbi:hypothetical protein CAPTEDRAFT_225339 [Capitella teleta]|uniref:Uncharacterized protein n=1 Tax=Capitella teleta TaxID=283909 RepID=R7TFG2_CAPTE|nr:hypothetical protein CAPTEDRAFT_225339 [Capitella teleta]|eukprot:ELT89761.1 hypothetical protein CAPTEDRAFT_225339 [Capitella teleta]
MKTMSELGAVMDEAKRADDRIAWRPTGKPKDDLRAHLMPIKLKQKEKLEALLSNHETDVQLLQKMVISRRARLAASEKKASDDVISRSQITERMDMERVQKATLDHELNQL